jgi:hypothetical protein
MHNWMKKGKVWREKRNVAKIIKENIEEKLKYIIEYWRELNNMEKERENEKKRN